MTVRPLWAQPMTCTRRPQLPVMRQGCPENSVLAQIMSLLIPSPSLELLFLNYLRFPETSCFPQRKGRQQEAARPSRGPHVSAWSEFV